MFQLPRMPLRTKMDGEWNGREREASTNSLAEAAGAYWAEVSESMIFYATRPW